MVGHPPTKSFLYLSEKIDALFAQLPLQNRMDRDGALPDKASALCEHLAKQPGLVGTVATAPGAFLHISKEPAADGSYGCISALLLALTGRTPVRGAPIQGRGIPTQKFEFVARKLERREFEGHAFLVGSPLYVAVSE
ncbi:MAG: hypothetical protein ABSC94_27605 [Polyangiaceae bacterium]|jgi:hypothetical protein